MQEYPWFPEGLEYESLDRGSAMQLETLLIGMVQVRRLGPSRQAAPVTRTQIKLCIATRTGVSVARRCGRCLPITLSCRPLMQGNPVLTLLEAVEKAAGGISSFAPWKILPR